VEIRGGKKEGGQVPGSPYMQRKRKRKKKLRRPRWRNPTGKGKEDLHLAHGPQLSFKSCANTGIKKRREQHNNGE